MAMVSSVTDKSIGRATNVDFLGRDYSLKPNILNDWTISLLPTPLDENRFPPSFAMPGCDGKFQLDRDGLLCSSSGNAEGYVGK